MFSWTCKCFSVAVVLAALVVVGTARAEDHKAAPKKDAHGHALTESEAEATTEKQTVNLMELRWELGLWTIVVFVLLFLILRKMAWGPMLEGLQRREDNILGALADAQKARDEAKTIRDDLKRQLDKASEQVRDILDEGRKRAEALANETMAKAKAEIQEEKGRLKRELKMEYDQALQSLWSETAQLATLVSAKTIRRQLSPEDHRRLVDEALAELKQAGDGFQRGGNGSST